MTRPVTSRPAGFVTRHELWDDRQETAAHDARRIIEELGIELIRFSFPDQHGVLRGKTITVSSFENVLGSGVTFPSTLLLKDTSGRTIYPVFSPGAGMNRPDLAGAADMVMVADLTTFRALPWAERTAWVLCDLYFPDGRVVPFSSRAVLAQQMDALDERGFGSTVGIEIEFHVFAIAKGALGFDDVTQPGAAPAVLPASHGYQLLSEERIDRVDEVVQLVHGTLRDLGIPVRSLEVEFGPSQLELTLEPLSAKDAADHMVLLRAAVRQVCRRHGYHATFMSRPRLPNLFPSGWHLHQSLVDRSTGCNRFVGQNGDMLSPVGRQALGGLLRHAAAASLFTTPTINGYKRYRPNSLAPDRIAWGVDNKAAMVRLCGVSGDPGTHLENRSGEPAANPYLYIASQIAAMAAGLEDDVDPGPPSLAPYAEDRPLLPRSLAAALDALEGDEIFAARMGTDVVSYMIDLKRFELDRFATSVTDWEHNEYMDLF